MNKSGTVLLLIVMLMSSCMALCMLFWRATACLHDVALVRNITCQQEALMRAYMQAAGEYCIRHFEDIVVGADIFFMQHKKIPLSHAGFSGGTMTITLTRQQKDQICIQAHLALYNHLIKKSCMVTRWQAGEEKRWMYKVHAWK